MDTAPRVDDEVWVSNNSVTDLFGKATVIDGPDDGMVRVRFVRTQWIPVEYVEHL